MKIGFDVDDILHEFVGNMIIHLNQHTGKNIQMEDINTWLMEECWQVNFEQLAEVIKNSGIYIDNPFYDGIVEKLKLLRSQGHEVHLITSRILYPDFDTELHTKLWFDKHNLEYDSLTITSDKGIRSNELGLDYFIDDSLLNIYKICKDSPNTKPFLRRRNRNKLPELQRLKESGKYLNNILEYIDKNVSIVDNVFEFIDYIEKKHNLNKY